MNRKLRRNIYSYVFIGLTLSLTSGHVVADRLPIAKLLELSGVQAQLEGLALTMVDETVELRSKCSESAVNEPRLDNILALIYAPEVILPVANQRIEESLSNQSLKSVADWYESPVGRRVITAESSLTKLSPQQIQLREDSLTQSSHWTSERRALIRQVLKATRTHEYFAAIHTALSATTKLTGKCALDAHWLNEQSLSVSQLESDANLVAFFMLNELVVPTGVVFDQLDDSELQQLIQFSRSEDGEAWHEALIQASRDAVLDGYADIHSILLERFQ